MMIGSIEVQRTFQVHRTLAASTGILVVLQVLAHLDFSVHCFSASSTGQWADTKNMAPHVGCSATPLPPPRPGPRSGGWSP